MELAELLRPGLSRSVEGLDLLAGEGVLDDSWVEVELAITVRLEQLARAVAKKLVQCHDQGQGLLRILDVDVFRGLVKEEHSVGLWRGVDVAEVHVLESFILPDVVVVGDVDADGRP